MARVATQRRVGQRVAMGAPGYDDAKPFVPGKAAPKTVTIIWPYYENPKWLRHQLRCLHEQPESVSRHLRLIVVDDGSPPAGAAEHVFRVTGFQPVPTRLFRLDVDIRWNWLGASNVGFHHAEGWCAKMDIDHVPPTELLRALIWGKFDPGTLYTLERIEHSGAPLHSHPNSFFCHRDTFWKIGGYDEALSGYYGTDGDWRRRAAAAVPIRRLPYSLVRYEYTLDSSTTRYKRKQPEDAGKKAIIRKRGKNWRPKVLSFPYHEVKLK